MGILAYAARSAEIYNFAPLGRAVQVDPRLTAGYPHNDQGLIALGCSASVLKL